MQNFHNSNRRLKNKISVITGAASGIGKAIAERLAAEGSFVIMLDINEEKLREAGSELFKLYKNIEINKVDISNPDEINNVMSKSLLEYSHIDILINNAGILNAKNAEQTTLEEWQKIINVNMTSAFLCSQAVYPSMAKQHYGKIINIGSIAGRSTSTTGGVGYTASKSGLMGLSRHLAKEWAQVGIRVNSICPGMVDTPMTRNQLNEYQLQHVIDTIPLRRMANPEEVASLAIFLASSESDFITGASIDINGGELIIA